MADARERRAVLHELFVEPERSVDGLDDRDLIVVVVDGELAREAGADGGERVAIAPQQAHAERMNVETFGDPDAPAFASRFSTRCRISSAALLVNVTASIDCAGIP